MWKSPNDFIPIITGIKVLPVSIYPSVSTAMELPLKPGWRRIIILPHLQFDFFSIHIYGLYFEVNAWLGTGEKRRLRDTRNGKCNAQEKWEKTKQMECTQEEQRKVCEWERERDREGGRENRKEGQRVNSSNGSDLGHAN